MGNRAVIEFEDESANGLGIYLHWNGGMDTVKPMLDVAREYGIRSDDYGVARLAQMFGNFFGGSLCVGVSIAKRMHRDNYDNGTYVIDKSFNIKERLFMRRPEQNVYDYNEMKQHIKAINDPFFLKEE